MIALKTRLTLLGIWLGAMAFFSFAVAPSAFVVLPEQHLAGNIVARLLMISELAGIVIGILLILILFFSKEKRSRSFYTELGVLSLMTASMAISHFVVSFRLRELRLHEGEQFYLLPPDSPTRLAFDQMHNFSVGLTSFAMIAALFLIIMLVRRSD